MRILQVAVLLLFNYLDSLPKLYEITYIGKTQNIIPMKYKAFTLLAVTFEYYSSALASGRNFLMPQARLEPMTLEYVSITLGIYPALPYFVLCPSRLPRTIGRTLGV